MIDEKLLQLNKELIEFAKKNGADEVLISINESKEFNVEVREGNIEKLTEADTKNFTIKVILDKKTASSTSNDLKVETLKKLIINSINRAKISSKDEFAELPPFKKFKIDNLGTYNKDVIDLKPIDKINYALKLEELSLKDKRITKSSGASFSTNTLTKYLSLSNGFSGAYETTYCTSGISLQSGQDTNAVEDGWWESSTSFINFPKPEVISKKAVERVTSLMNGKKIKSENLPVIFDSSVASSIIGFLASCLNGHSIYLKNSFLSGKLGEKIAPDFLNLIDDGRIPGAIGSKPFDNEGNPVQSLKLIENGVLKSYFLDHYSAKKLNLESTGHSGGLHNLYLSPGKNSLEELIKDTQRGLYIIKTIGQGTVPTTGDISKGAFGIMIEDGKLTYPVNEITFSGNLSDILKNIVSIANDLRFRGSINSPSFKVKEITIAGS